MLNYSFSLLCLTLTKDLSPLESLCWTKSEDPKGLTHHVAYCIVSQYDVQVLGEETREKETEQFERYEERMIWT